MDWPKVEAVTSVRLYLEPLSVEHALGMVEVLGDASMYGYTGGEAPSLERLKRRYAAQSLEHSEDGMQGWFNWIVKPKDSDTPIGFVQATVERSGPDLVANIAWVISPIHQDQGMASEAANAMNRRGPMGILASAKCRSALVLRYRLAQCPRRVRVGNYRRQSRELDSPSVNHCWRCRLQGFELVHGFNEMSCACMRVQILL